jgi:hypothetical protein
MTCPCCCVAAVPGLNMRPSPTSALQEGYSPWSVTRVVVMPGPPSLVGGWVGLVRQPAGAVSSCYWVRTSCFCLHSLLTGTSSSGCAAQRGAVPGMEGRRSPREGHERSKRAV